jgi:glucosamine--fructose-6-phosphate aminotransferase (isomerizing)
LFILSKGAGCYVSDFCAEKFTQISTIHAEAYSSAEFRHGPLSMLDEDEKTAVIFLVLDDETITQVLSNILQVKERGATVIVLTNVPKIETLIELHKIDYLIRLFEQKSMFAALQCTIPMLMMCYYTALEKGINPDEKISDSINF